MKRCTECGKRSMYSLCQRCLIEFTPPIDDDAIAFEAADYTRIALGDVKIPPPPACQKCGEPDVGDETCLRCSAPDGLVYEKRAGIWFKI